MSQYPSPSPYSSYGPPVDFSRFQPVGADLLAPARRAGTLMIVLGMLVALFGLCNAGSALVTSTEEIAAQQAALRAPGMPESPLSPQATRIAAAIVAGLTLLVGIGFAVNGGYVRRGSGTAVTLGLIFAGGLAVLVGFFMVLSVAAAFVAPLYAGFACVLAVPLGLLIWQMAWLLSAARSNSAVAAARQQYQAQFYAYQQHQQGYGQVAYPPAPAGYGAGGYGYGYPPPAPAQHPPPQPAPPQAGPGTNADNPGQRPPTG